MTELVRLLKASDAVAVSSTRASGVPGRRSFRTFRPRASRSTSPTSSETFGHEMCPVAWYFAQVEPDGEVCFCGDFPDYFIGNVRTQAFRDIWTGEKARAVPRQAREGAAADLRALLRKLRLRQMGTPGGPPGRENVPEPVEVEPLGRVEADHALEVRGDAHMMRGGVFVGGEARIGRAGARPRR